MHDLPYLFEEGSELVAHAAAQHAAASNEEDDAASDRQDDDVRVAVVCPRYDSTCNRNANARSVSLTWASLATGSG